MTTASVALARLQAKTGNNEEALRLADRTLRTNPALVPALLTRAQSLIGRGEIREGEAVLKEVLLQDPVSLSALAQLLKLSMSQGKTADMVQQLSGLARQHPQDAGLHVLLAAAYFNLKDFKNSEATVRQAIALDPKATDAYTLLANIDFANNEPEQAEKDLLIAIDLAPNNLQNYISLGIRYENTGRWDEAKKLFAKAHQIDPNAPLVAVELAYLYLDHGGDVNVAASLAQVAQKSLPNSPVPTDALGWAYYKMGSVETGIHQLETSVRMVPKNSMYQYHLGMAYLAARRFGLATMSLEKALKEDPKSPYAASIRTALQEASGKS
jgi:tetratricopeptide (TPR) repeat protein